MLIQPVDYALLAWFVLAGLSALYVAVDQFRGNPEPGVMKWGFILVTLYLGPIGLLLYVLADKEPHPLTHERFTAPLWKQGVGSTIHCVAGDATGIIVSAVVVALLGVPMWLDLIIEYLSGFALGLFVFQSLFMKRMMGGSYLENVRRSFVPEFISMNFMMAGMAPVMTFLMMGRDMRAMEPTELLFWGVMSAGVLTGFALAYPSNVWMVAQGIKHGLMTVRGDKSASAAEAHEHGHDTAAMPKDMGGGGHAAHGEARGKDPAFGLTRPQLAAVTGISMLALVIGMVTPANTVNMTLSARDVQGSIMPPGMIMTRDTPAAAMLDMAAVKPHDVSYRGDLTVRGDTEARPRIENGVKVFELTASVISWQILPGQTVDAYAFNNQVPGPRLHFTEGDRVRIIVHNRLPETTTVHWHGLIVPNAMDGPADITQSPIPVGGDFTYEFTASQSGTYFYHTHDHSDRQQALGLYGALVIDPKVPDPSLAATYDYAVQLQEWLTREGLTYPAMPMEGGMPNFFTINGRAYPATDTVGMRVGETIRLRFIGTNNGFIHPMHVHGGPFEVVAIDGQTLAPSARFEADTVNIAPGQRYDVIWTARAPGKWLVHCHIPHHTTNNNAEEDGGGGLTMILDVSA